MKPTKQEIEKQVIAAAKVLVQAAGVRLAMSKKEEAAKAEINALMNEHKLTFVSDKVTMDGRKVGIEVEMKSSQSSSIDIDKLTKMLTPEQFKQCASVTLKAAKEILPQAMVDQCTTVIMTPPVAKVTADKGYPVPVVPLFR